MSAPFHLGVILPNYDEGASADAVRLVAEAAEELGFDSVWTTEHLLVGADAPERFHTTLDSLTCLAWLAGLTERVALGTSIVVLPLHHPVHVAKRAATIQQLSGNRLKLGIGIGWYEPEFRFLGVPFEGRGRYADEAVRLMRVLWAGEREFHGELWSFEDAVFGPLPAKPPELWVGGGSVQRALRHGAVWHPNAGPDEIRHVKERHPELRIVPRVPADADLAELKDAGCDGAVLGFAGDAESVAAKMADVARER